jgi:hypothetical protein
MIPVAILGFLVGAVFGWGFRVWILIPTTMLLLAALTVYQWSEGAHFLPAIAIGFLISITPQLGYAFGLVARTAVLMLPVPRKTTASSPARRRSATSI